MTLPEGPGAEGYGHLKLLDLGLVRLDEEPGDLILTRVRSVLGTPDFISPEQACDARTVDIRSDLYSLGCSFYFLLTGHVPFPDGTGIEKIMCHQLERPRAINLLRPNVPDDVQAVVAKLMRKEPQERYQTPAEVSAIMTRLAVRMPRVANWPPRRDASLPTPSPRNPSTPGDVLQTERIQPLPAPIKPAAGLLHGTRLPAFEPSVAPGMSRLPPPPSVLPPPSLLPQASPLRPSLVPDRPPPPAAGEVGCRVVTVSGAAAPAAPSMVPAQTAARIAVLQGHIAPVVSMAFAPRGRLLASGGLDHAVRIWRLDVEDTRQESAFQDDRLGEIRAMTFLPDGDLVLAAAGMGGRVWRWCWRGNKTQDLAALEGSSGARVLAVSGDGALLAAAHEGRVFVWVATRAGLKPIAPLIGRGHEITALAFSSDSQRLVAGDSHGRVMSWSYNRRFRPEATFSPHSGPITALAISPDDRCLITAGTDNALRSWSDLDEFHPLSTMTAGLRGVVRCLGFDSEGTTMLAVTDAGQVTGWRARRGEAKKDWRLNQPVSTSQALAGAANMAAVGRTDGAVNLYRLVSSGSSLADATWR